MGRQFNDQKKMGRQCNDQKKKRTERQTMIYKTLQRKLKIEQHESHQKLRVNSCAPEG
jgi:hypothetical protein